jgi:hypothetical protein
MQVRNPQYNALNTINCEIEHPQFGWIPFTATPDDVEQMGRDIYSQAVAGAYGPVAPYTPPTKTPEQIQAEIVASTQQRLDNFSKTRNYDGILSLCTYASSPNAAFQAEGQYGVEARDATWTTLLEILAEVEAGTRPMPTGYADIEPELPPLVWPDAAV